MKPSILVFVVLCGTAAGQDPPAPLTAAEVAALDTSSRILDSSGNTVTTVNVKNGRLDFARPAGLSRADFLKSLHNTGMRQLFVPVLQALISSS